MPVVPVVVEVVVVVVVVVVEVEGVEQPFSPETWSVFGVRTKLIRKHTSLLRMPSR